MGSVLHAPLGKFLFGTACLLDPNSSIKLAKLPFHHVLNNAMYHVFRRIKSKAKGFLSSWPELVKDLTELYKGNEKIITKKEVVFTLFSFEIWRLSLKRPAPSRN